MVSAMYISSTAIIVQLRIQQNLFEIERKTKQIKKVKVNKISNMAVWSIYHEDLEKNNMYAYCNVLFQVYSLTFKQLRKGTGFNLIR